MKGGLTLRDKRQKKLLDDFIAEHSTDGDFLDGPRPFYLTHHTCCRWCKFYHGDNKCSCDAYPNGIPDKFALWIWGDPQITHNSIEPDQAGDYVFSAKHYLDIN